MFSKIKVGQFSTENAEKGYFSIINTKEKMFSERRGAKKEHSGGKLSFSFNCRHYKTTLNL